jgi:hypothetical protein
MSSAGRDVKSVTTEDVGAIYTSLDEVLRVLDVVHVSKQWRRRLLIVVARDAQPHYEYLSKAFAGLDWAHVVLDRRHGERRATDRGHLDPRHRDRRRRRDVEQRLQTAPWAILAF